MTYQPHQSEDLTLKGGDDRTIYGLVHRVDGVLMADERRGAVQLAAHCWNVDKDPDYTVRALTDAEIATLVPNDPHDDLTPGADSTDRAGAQEVPRG